MHANTFLLLILLLRTFQHLLRVHSQLLKLLLHLFLHCLHLSELGELLLRLSLMLAHRRHLLELSIFTNYERQELRFECFIDLILSKILNLCQFTKNFHWNDLILVLAD